MPNSPEPHLTTRQGRVLSLWAGSGHWLAHRLREELQKPDAADAKCVQSSFLAQSQNPTHKHGHYGRSRRSRTSSCCIHELRSWWSNLWMSTSKQDHKHLSRNARAVWRRAGRSIMPSLNTPSQSMLFAKP